MKRMFIRYIAFGKIMWFAKNRYASHVMLEFGHVTSKVYCNIMLVILQTFSLWTFILIPCQHQFKKKIVVFLFGSDEEIFFYPLKDCYVKTVIIVTLTKSLELDQTPSKLLSDQSPSCLKLRLYLFF